MKKDAKKSNKNQVKETSLAEAEQHKKKAAAILAAHQGEDDNKRDFSREKGSYELRKDLKRFAELEAEMDPDDFAELLEAERLAAEIEEQVEALKAEEALIFSEEAGNTGEKDGEVEGEGEGEGGRSKNLDRKILILLIVIFVGTLVSIYLGKVQRDNRLLIQDKDLENDVIGFYEALLDDDPEVLRFHCDLSDEAAVDFCEEHEGGVSVLEIKDNSEDNPLEIEIIDIIYSADRNAAKVELNISEDLINAPPGNAGNHSPVFRFIGGLWKYSPSALD